MKKSFIKKKTQKDVLDQLDSSLAHKLPKKFQGMTVEKMITEAKKIHYQKRTK